MFDLVRSLRRQSVAPDRNEKDRSMLAGQFGSRCSTAIHLSTPLTHARTQLRSRSDTWTGICSQDSSATHLPQKPLRPGILLLLQCAAALPAFDGRDGASDHGGGSRTVGSDVEEGSQTRSIEISCPRFRLCFSCLPLELKVPGNQQNVRAC